MIETDRYQNFLDRAATNLASAGYEPLLHPGIPAAPWTSGWDQVFLGHAPGEATLYGLTRWEGEEAAQLRARIDRLARGLSENGALQGAPLRLVTVIVLPEGGSERQKRELLRLGPSIFLTGLRPATRLVDLSTGEIVGGRRLGSDPEMALLEGAADRRRAVVDPGEGEILRRQHSERMNAFYSLMRGRQPWVTYGLVGVNVALFLLTFLSAPTTNGESNVSTLISFGALVPRRVLAGEWWRLFTAIFLHASIQHILFNMMSLLAVGVLAERLYGSTRFLGIYLGAGLIGSLASLGFAMISGTLDVPGVGASGAIFGVAGALVTVRLQNSEVIPRALRDRVSNTMIPLILISLIFAYLTPYVDNAAHVGGLAGGMILSFLFPLTKRVPEVRG